MKSSVFYFDDIAKEKKKRKAILPNRYGPLGFFDWADISMNSHEKYHD